MIVKTEAIVLRCMKYGDTSKIVSVLTREYGRLSLIAKGARDRKNRLGPALDLMNHVQVVFYRKEHRDLHLLSQCDVLHRFGDLAADLKKIAHGMTVLELAAAVSHSEEDSQQLFDAVFDSLGALDTEYPGSVMLHFETRLLSVLGFRPELMVCSVCGNPPEMNGTKTRFFRLTSGGITCVSCNNEDRGARIRSETVDVLRTLQNGISAREAGNVRIPSAIGREAKGILRHYLKSHVGGFDVLKSERVFSEVL